MPLRNYTLTPQNCHGPLCTAKRLSYDIAIISETTTPIDKKFQDNICTTKMCPAMQSCDVITNPRWRTAAILKIVKSPYLSSEKSSDFDEIWHTTADIEHDDSLVTKNLNSRWRRPPSRKSLFWPLTHQPIVRFQLNFAPGSRTACRQRPHDKNCKCSKSKMTAAILTKSSAIADKPRAAGL